MKILSTILITIVVLLVLIGGGIFFLRNNTPEVEAPSNEVQDITFEEDAAPMMDELSGEQITVDESGSASLEGDMIEDAPVSDGDTSLTLPPGQTGAEEATISMTDTGFVPAEITIPAGTSVTFVNNGQAAHWPASDVHPTHQILPEFDSKRGLTTGETYTYTFTEPGTWNMHDHLHASFTGTIIVE